jgi:hypothetical protein
MMQRAGHMPPSLTDDFRKSAFTVVEGIQEPNESAGICAGHMDGLAVIEPARADTAIVVLMGDLLSVMMMPFSENRRTHQTSKDGEDDAASHRFQPKLLREAET